MKKLFGLLGRVLSAFWTALSFTRQLILNLVFIVFLISVIYFIRQFNAGYHNPNEAAQKPKALVLSLAGPIIEKREMFDPLSLISNNLSGNPPPVQAVLFEIVNKIRKAGQDPSINGLVLDLKLMPEAPLTKLRYIAKAINEFKATGKKVVATSSFFSQSQYYLASYADEIHLNSDGAVLLTGYGTYSLYFKQLLDKLDVSTHVFRVGSYKSAVEPYLRSDMSAEARDASSVWLNQVWGAYVDDVVQNRKLKPEQVAPNSEQLLQAMQHVKGDTAKLALHLGLVDKLFSRQQSRLRLAELFGSNGKDSFNYVSIYDYPLPPPTHPNAPQVAVFVASGVIVDGLDGEGQVGGDSAASQLRQARLDDNIKAVVLRIDSPGGSAFASEVIRNEISALKAAGKPVVASMSSVAASGGYWIAASADHIIAQPTTLTGSIGIFGLLATFEKTLAKYGVYGDGIGTTPYANLNVTRALPSEINTLMQLGIESGYQRFISLVATERKLPLENVEKIAQGRVWTGANALEHKLIDQIGDFDDAVLLAAKLAKLEKYTLNWLEEPIAPFELFISEFFGQVLSKFGVKTNAALPPPVQKLLNTAQKELDILQGLNDPQGHYVLCTDCQL